MKVKKTEQYWEIKSRDSRDIKMIINAVADVHIVKQRERAQMSLCSVLYLPLPSASASARTGACSSSSGFRFVSWLLLVLGQAGVAVLWRNVRRFEPSSSENGDSFSHICQLCNQVSCIYDDHWLNVLCNLVERVCYQRVWLCISKVQRKQRFYMQNKCASGMWFIF